MTRPGLQTATTPDAGNAPAADAYIRERVLARGGFSTVHIARDERTGRRVAYKVLTVPADPVKAEEFRRRFVQEGEVLRRLRHPHIVALLDTGETVDGCFLTMELLEGPRLADVIKQGPVPAAVAATWMHQVCAALGAAHARGIVHRDLKPANLMFCVDGAPDDALKIIDFGVVKRLDHDAELTMHGDVVGSPACMAPEQIAGGAIGPWTDIYAVGVLLYRMVTGRFPFVGNNATLMMLAHLEQPVPSIRSNFPDLPIPPGFDELVQRCLAKEPEHRYVTATEVARDLEAWTPRDRRVPLDPGRGDDAGWLGDAPDDVDDLTSEGPGDMELEADDDGLADSIVHRRPPARPAGPAWTTAAASALALAALVGLAWFAFAG